MSRSLLLWGIEGILAAASPVDGDSTAAAAVDVAVDRVF